MGSNLFLADTRRGALDRTGAQQVGCRILHLCSDTFPPQYVFIERVFNHLLPARGYIPSWVMSSTKTDEIEPLDWDGHSLHLIPKCRHGGSFSMLLNYARHVGHVRTAARLAAAAMPRVELVQVRNDPVMARIGLAIARRQGVPFVYQLSHLKEEQVIDFSRQGIVGGRLKNYLKGSVGLAMRNRLLRAADLVFPISTQMLDALAAYGVDRTKMVALPEGVDTKNFANCSPADIEAARHKYALTGKRVFVYLGAMGRQRELDVLIKAFAPLAKQQSDLLLLMVGRDAQPGDLDALRAKASELGVSSQVTFTGFVSHDEIPALLRAADVGVSPIPNNRIYATSSPIKILEYMAAGLPVVASNIPSQQEVLAAAPCGLCVGFGATSLADAMAKLMSASAGERRSYGQRGREYCVSKRDFEILSQRVIDAYDRLPLGGRVPRAARRDPLLGRHHRPSHDRRRRAGAIEHSI